MNTRTQDTRGLRECGREVTRGRRERRSRGGILATDGRSETGTRGNARAFLWGLVAFSMCVFVSPRRINAGDVASGLYGPGRVRARSCTRASLTGGCQPNRNRRDKVPNSSKDWFLRIARRGLAATAVQSLVLRNQNRLVIKG